MTDFNNQGATDLLGKVVRPKVLLTLFLGSLGLSSLTPIYYIITRRDRNGGKGWTFHEERMNPLSPPEPRVKIRPVRGEGLICQICMGKLKHGLPHVKCDCGKIFHITCLKRTEFCPYCQRTYTPEQVEEIAVYPEMECIKCPMCERTVYKDSGTCECGAIISDEDGMFYCPVCGTQIREGENECPYCHERFEDIRLVICPFCGREFDASRGGCDCGSFLGEICPECGVRLTPEDQCCSNCGTFFETVERA